MLPLLAVVAFRNRFLDTLTPSPRLSSSSELVLSQLFFQDCTSDTEGGALSLDDCTVSLTKCGFVNCHATNLGGAIYHSIGSLSMNQNCFALCGCTTYTGTDNGGNVFETVNVTVAGSDNSAYLCSEVSTADSVFHCFYASCQLVNWNTSFCNGWHGSSMGALHSVSDSYIHMSNNINCVDYASLEARSSYLTITLCNIINNTLNNIANVWGNKNEQMLFKECAFIQHSTRYVTEFSSFSFLDCYSDTGDAWIPLSSGVTQVNNPPMEQSICGYATECFTAQKQLPVAVDRLMLFLLLA